MAAKSFSDKHAEPPVHPANPGIGVKMTIATSGPTRNSTEDVDLLAILREVLAKGGWMAEEQNGWLVSEAGLWLRPQFVSFQPRDDGLVTTCTTIEVAHPLMLPEPCFEYQHSIGDSFTVSIRTGFEQWAQIDWPVFVDLVSHDQHRCMRLEFTPLDNDATSSGLARRVLLGPPAHMVASPSPAAAEGEAHNFCPCCLFTNSWESFKPLIESNGTSGLRLFAMRDESGKISVDCRLNGVDFEAGAQALRAYAATWPERGFEYRKQYVLIGPQP